MRRLVPKSCTNLAPTPPLGPSGLLDPGFPSDEPSGAWDRNGVWDAGRPARGGRGERQPRTGRSPRSSSTGRVACAACADPGLPGTCSHAGSARAHPVGGQRRPRESIPGGQFSGRATLCEPDCLVTHHTVLSPFAIPGLSQVAALAQPCWGAGRGPRVHLRAQVLKENGTYCPDRGADGRSVRVPEGECGRALPSSTSHCAPEGPALSPGGSVPYKPPSCLKDPSAGT